MDVNLSEIAARGEGRPEIAQRLRDVGFIVIPGLVDASKLPQLSAAYDAAMASATGNDIRIGSTCTRVSDFVNRGPEFDDLYVFPPLFEAARHVIGRPFKLSSFLGRTVRPRTAAQDFHVDVQRHSTEWPLLGFILMIDEFRPDNGATRFVPGSHLWQGEDPISVVGADHGDQVLACGVAGSLLVFNGSVWHGHGANRSGEPRRSLQGAFIPRDGQAATDFAAIMDSGTRDRLGVLARNVLAL